MSERAWKIVIFVGGVALLVGLFVLGVNLAVIVGRAATGFVFRKIFPSPWPH